MSLTAQNVIPSISYVCCLVKSICFSLKHVKYIIYGYEIILQGWLQCSSLHFVVVKEVTHCCVVLSDLDE